MHQNPALAGLKRHARTPFLIFNPVFGAHISVEEFQYPDNNWKDVTGIIANLVAKSSDNKG